MLKKIVLFVLSLLLIVSVFALTACGGSDSSTSSASKSVAVKDVVPQKANLVARISLSALGAKDVRSTYDKIDKGPNFPATYDELLKTIQGKVGIDLRDLQETVVFADIPGATFSQDENATFAPYAEAIVNPLRVNYRGAIVNGSFKQSDIIAVLEKTLGHNLQVETYNGTVIYLIQGSLGIGTLSDLGARLAFLSENNLIIGSDQAVKDVIDVTNGNEEGLSGEFLDLYEGLGNPQAKLAMEIPAEWLTQIPDERDIPVVGKVQLNVFKDMRMATLVVDRAGDAAVIEIKVDFYNSDSANDAKQTIDGIVNILQGLTKMTGGQTARSGVAALAKLLNSLQLSVSGTWLTLHLALTAEQLGELVPMFQGISSGK